LMTRPAIARRDGTRAGFEAGESKVLSSTSKVAISGGNGLSETLDFGTGTWD
jgi:hypothetical protein